MSQDLNDALDVPSKKKAKRSTNKKTKRKSGQKARVRKARPYPASSFADARSLGEAIIKYAAGEKVRRLTLLEKMVKSPTSSATHLLITNSGKYGITTGSYLAEYLELTANGRKALDPESSLEEQKRASFQLAIDGVAPFKLLYDHYKDKRLAERDIIKDVLRESDLSIDDYDECVDTFIVNAKELGLLRTIGGAETLVSIDQVVEDLDKNSRKVGTTPPVPNEVKKVLSGTNESQDWKKICFYITPIGSEDSEQRKHSDLFMSSLVQPALEELGLTVVRADQIGEPGMITTQVLECLKRSRLAIADLSYLNPNVLYEVGLRHALKLPVVQIIRKVDKLPFDVNQSRTLVFDTTDIYTLIPKLQTYRAEIANQARKALEDPESVGNPISVFYPDFYKNI